MEKDRNGYSVLFVNGDGLFHLTIQTGVRKMSPIQMETLKTSMLKTQCTIVPQRFAQLEAEATSSETGLDIMTLIISLAHEALPISVEKFKRAMMVASLNDVVSILKLLRLSVNMNFKFRIQGRFIYKLKDFEKVLGSDQDADETKYTKVVTYAGSEATMQLKDESWSSTSQTTLNVFRSLDKAYFGVSNGRRIEIIEKNAEPSLFILDYFRNRGPQYPPILDYYKARWANQGEDPTLMVVLHLLDLIYSGKNPVNFQTKISL